MTDPRYVLQNRTKGRFLFKKKTSLSITLHTDMIDAPLPLAFTSV